MRWVRHADLDSFMEAAGDHLRADPLLNQMPLGFVATLRAEPSRYGPEVRLRTVHAPGGECVGAAVQTPPWKAQLSRMDLGAAAFAGAAYAEEQPGYGGAMGSGEVAAAFVAAGFARVGAAGIEEDARMGMYALTEVAEIRRAKGQMRPAEAGDAPLLQRWTVAFHDEAVPMDPAPGPGAGERYATSGKARIWLDEVGDTVAFANHPREVEGFLSIGPVYTPPELRGQGYATSLVAAMCDAALAAGKRGCTLFADVKNPTSNAIYQRIGFRRMGEVARFVYR